MGIEDDLKAIREKLDITDLRCDKMQTVLEDLNEMVDLLTIRKQVKRQDKEKRIKDSLQDNSCEHGVIGIRQ
jgi:hypothetical protein